MKSRPAASILAQQGGSLLKFDFENRSPVFLTLLPQAQNKPKVHSRAETGTALGCASREFHPSEDLSELPPLRVAVAGQEYQRWCCHRKTDRPRSAFWTNGPANHLPFRIDADFCTGGSSRVSPMSLANSLSLHGTPADVFPLLDMYLRRCRSGGCKKPPHYLSVFSHIHTRKVQKLPIKSIKFLSFDSIFLSL